ncbi:hypothetical protein MCOR02_002866 [Pyricularia oryzae]|uniref:Uncharacterized protein n=1 Tax=Pyricularia oryzae TaxID=318829 RepID=A0A4P7N3C3_PYROR|nr:hypothetical protein MCOR02_002866 [Pyricularia oryzae]KAI6370198.1 hypothetical protein MCOR31_004763 [Pyricularia oryzae]KAI7915898.1 hypothetical protein M9X92_008158 [Pyricularia oryzae]KAI7917220.1 hypothetical protein M0657_008198 [Pyricularia oryzae]QBZ56919.1 hypothetical protein PoMZ_01837 [Pyricularia oryzae]
MWNQKMEGDKATWSKAKQSVFGSRKPSALLSPGIPVPMFKNTLSDYICLTSPESGYTANSEKLVRSGHGQFEQRIDMTLK